MIHAFKYLMGLALVVAMFTGCTKKNDDISFINSAAAPSNVSALFTVTQDNSGIVTLLPSGEGVAYFEVYFGDATTAPAKVLAGNVVRHRYLDGNYTVKFIAHSIDGKTTEVTKPLTVSFKAPENVVINTGIDGANSFKLSVSATAQFETYFKVLFGEGVGEVAQPFTEGDTLTHVYAANGSYTITVIAFSGGKDSTIAKKTVAITDPLKLPLTFESTTLNYAFTDFDGGNTTVVANPQMNGINSSAKVAKMVKNAGQTWGGSWIGMSSPIDFSTNKIFRMKVYSPRVGAKVLLKVENASSSSTFYEVQAVTTVANAWEDLVFDYSAINTSKTYDHIVLIFDNGTMGDGSANYTFLLDDIRLTNSLPTASSLALPLDFESSTLKYKFTDFGGGAVSVISNPQANGINTSGNVGKMVKNQDQVYGGSLITLDNPIDFTGKNTFTMKVFSPRAGAKVLLKVENLTNPNLSFEKEVKTGSANAWETLSFDYSAIHNQPAGSTFQKVVLIFDNGIMGDGSANYTFLFDDINLN